LSWSLLAVSALASPPDAPPTVVFDASPRGATVSITAPPGQKLAPDAPWTLALEDAAGVGVTLRGPGASLVNATLAVPALAGAVTGALDVGLCSLDGTTCRPTSWALSGALATGRKVHQPLQVAPPPAPEAPFGPQASASQLDEALARAKTSGKAVLVDFSAAWCPPCNQLAAELLHATPPDPALDGYEVVVLDADHPSSFPAKDRYDVGGYPSLLVLDAEGTERTRVVGYPGLEAMRTWLAGAAEATDAAELADGPTSVDGPRAAALAWWLASAGRDEEAAPWLARAEETHAETAERHLAALVVRSDPAELQWVLTHAPERALDALPAASRLAEEHPALVTALCDAAEPLAQGTVAADLLELRAATVTSVAERQALLRGAAAVLIARRTGVPELDKPHLTRLASLLERSGQPDAAVALLIAASGQWSTEPTYDLALAPLLVRLGRAAEALPVAERAEQRAWGDNHLRAAAAHARVLAALGRNDEARQVASSGLAAQPAPPPGTNPRTDRYREALRKLAEPPAN
jgi:hypothetical protein